jgi:hypothetical protein
VTIGGSGNNIFSLLRRENSRPWIEFQLYPPLGTRVCETDVANCPWRQRVHCLLLCQIGVPFWAAAAAHSNLPPRLASLKFLNARNGGLRLSTREREHVLQGMHATRKQFLLRSENAARQAGNKLYSALRELRRVKQSYLLVLFTFNRILQEDCFFLFSTVFKKIVPLYFLRNFHSMHVCFPV